MSWKNLDVQCAKTGDEIGEPGSKECEKLIREALAILEEQGVYAMFLKLAASQKGSALKKPLINLLKESLPEGEGLFQKDILFALRDLAQDLDQLILARDLLRQSLIYGLAHTRLATDKEERQGGES